MIRNHATICLFLLFTFPYLHGQELQFPTLSPRSEITQEVGLTEIKVSYARPSAKGRAVFGGLVPYGEIWRTGANASTQLTFNEAVKVGGNDLPAGTYALYTIPGEESWTIIIHKNTSHRAIAGDTYKQEEDAFRFSVQPIANPLTVETFTLQFTDLTTTGCSLALSWANTMVKFPIEVAVDAKIEAQISAVLSDPEKASHQNYFRSAEYYLHNGKDLEQAASWILTALEKSPKNFRYGLLHAKILAAQDKGPEALQVIEKANQWAVEANNSNYIEQTRLYWEDLKG